MNGMIRKFFSFLNLKRELWDIRIQVKVLEKELAISRAREKDNVFIMREVVSEIMDWKCPHCQGILMFKHRPLKMEDGTTR